jgi:tRNA threonylcarbamoyl adenosine modification protein (Sua5/YciO/YrdC/YwlC family)
MLLKINPKNPEVRKIRQVADCLREGGVIIYPTDTVYAFACDLASMAAIERICFLRGLNPSTAMLTLVCQDISQASAYTRPIPTPVFKVMKKNLPGPFTFVLAASNEAPKLFKNRKRTIGIRVPAHPIPQAIVAALGRPLVSASLKAEEVEFADYITDPFDIYTDYQKLVDIVVDGGLGGAIPSTVIDCTQEAPEVIREGLATPQL